MYSATACPGPYLLSKIDYIIEEANKIISGGNITTTPVTITYQAYDGAWLGQITGYDANNAKYGYAGVIGRPMSGIYANASIGNVYYRVHQKGGSWLPEVKNREDYAGNLGKPIDGFMIKSDSTKLTYRAHDKVHGWLSEISGYDINNSSAGYAGWIGYDIDAIMIKADPIVTITEPPKVEEPAPAPTPTKELYRVRKSWEDAKSQAGAFTSLEGAKKVCSAAGPEYSVYNSKGEKVYPTNVIIETPAAPDPAPVEPKPEVKPVEPETKPAEPTTPDPVVPEPEIVEPAPAPEKPKFPYLVKITANSLNVRENAGMEYKIRTRVRKNEVYTITEEKNGFGKLKSGAGWILLEFTKKI
jgi:hypothetical protein